VSEAGFVGDALRATAAELFGGDDHLVALSTLADLGWADLAADDLSVAVSVLADEQGRRLGVSRLVELAMAAAAPFFDPDDAALVFAVRPGQGTAFRSGAVLDGIVLADGGAAPRFAVPVEEDGRVLLRMFSSSDVEVISVSGLDPDARITRIRAGAARGTDIDDVPWGAAVAVGSLAVAHEMLGTAAAMLDLAVSHVTDRRQFGVPIGSFQAVHHRLADVLIDLEAGRAVCETAWRDRDPFMGAAARSAAGRAVETAVRQCQQVCGAMGSTWEHRLHRYQRRGLLLGRLLDPSAILRGALSSVLVEQRRVEVLEP